MPHGGQDVLDIERLGQAGMSHIAACGICHLVVLQMELRVHEGAEITCMIVMKMGNDHVGDGCCIHPQRQKQRRGFGSASAPAPRRAFDVEAGIDNDRATLVSDHPNEIIEGGTPVS